MFAYTHHLELKCAKCGHVSRQRLSDNYPTFTVENGLCPACSAWGWRNCTHTVTN